MKVLLTGARGQLGRAIRAFAPESVDLVALDHLALDISEPESVGRMVKVRPELVINAAAYTAVDAAESNEESARAVNREGVRHVTKAASEISARVVHVSTDFVFGGTVTNPYTVDAQPGPSSVYGSTKREGEVVLLESEVEGVVLRTSRLYSRNGHNFVTMMLELMANRDELRVIDDQIGAPTWADNLAEAIWSIADTPRVRGVRHWTDDGSCTWFEFAQAIQESALERGLLRSAIPISPVSTSAYRSDADRPAYSVLDTSVLAMELSRNPMPWRQALDSMLDAMSEDHRDE